MQQGKSKEKMISGQIMW